jgi:hypothetical protein
MNCKRYNKCLWIAVSVIALITFSCYIPRQIHYYEPESEGDEFTWSTSHVGPSDTLEFEISDGVKSMIRCYAGGLHEEYVYLYVGIEVPEGKSVKLASDVFEIHSADLSTPDIAKVVSIQEMKGSVYFRYPKRIKEDNKKVLAPRLQPDGELIGHSDRMFTLVQKNHAFYTLHFRYGNSKPRSDKVPENISVHYPDLYINGELISIEPIQFKWTPGIEALVDPL